jgi:hypothetical protein
MRTRKATRGDDNRERRELMSEYIKALKALMDSFKKLGVLHNLDKYIIIKRGDAYYLERCK